MDSTQLEQEILAFWRREKVFERSLKVREGQKPFVFYEGPPSANAKPGIHHILARAFKDLIPRFKTMQGFHVARKAGWDTHGLPIEVQAEKELGLKSKRDIEKYGVAKFNAYCRKLVFRYQKDWEDLTRRIGFWLDLDDPYITYENSYIEKLWEIIKQFHEKSLLYKGHKVVPHCPRCGTSLSSHEVAQGYEEISEPAVYVKFKILDGEYKGNFIGAWTTTPWTLPGNVALAVGKNIKYVKVGDLILAKDRLTDVQPENTLEVITGSTSVNVDKLIGSRYEPLYPFLAGKSKDAHTIVDADFVSTQEGTGVVHTAVMYGEDDYKLADRFDLPKIHTVDEDGKFKDFVKPFAGKYVKDADQDIIADLEKRGLLFKKGNYTHSYPFCWRCETPLLYYAKDSWFVAMSKLKKQLTDNNKQITWIPDHLRDGRFGEFLKEVKDWAFSRERYWGTPLPVWVCQGCLAVEVIGSVEELRSKIELRIKNQESSKKSVIHNSSFFIQDLHRPYIDKIKWTCQSCGKSEMVREPYVVDVWFDSGSMPYASGEKQAGRFPADFIAEAIDQTRGWFYTLLAVSTALGDQSPYKAVISTGHVLDAKGQKMSKSKGNVIDPDEVIKKYGADALRWYFYVMNQPGDNKAFVEKDLVTYKNKTLGLLWNVYNYYATYLKTQKLKLKASAQKSKVLDRWITARLHETVKQVTNDLENYKVTEAGRGIMALIDDLSTWYLRRSRGRQDSQFFNTLYSVLLTIAKLMAPFMPFNAEALYRRITNHELRITEKTLNSSFIIHDSVHLEDWPKYDEKLIDEKLLDDMAVAREIVSQALKLRADAGIKVRQPLSELRITNQELREELTELIKDEVNVKKIVSSKKLALDTKITADLEKEGIAREIVRTLQELRKQAGYKFDDKVEAFYATNDKQTLAAFKTHQKLIERETLAKLKKSLPAKVDKKTQVGTLILAVKKR